MSPTAKPKGTRAQAAAARNESLRDSGRAPAEGPEIGTERSSQSMAAAEWAFDRSLLGDPQRALAYEWLETNGVGGWAGSSILGAHTRRYHGMLVAATNPPAGRLVLLSRLDEALRVGEETFHLSSNVFPGVVDPRGYEHLESFRRGLFPVWEYVAGGVRLRKTVAGVDGENTTLVLYEALEAPGAFTVELLPFFAGRDYHALGHAREVGREADFSAGVLCYAMGAGVPAVFLAVPGAEFRPGPDWYYNFDLPREEERGFDHREDLFTPGVLAVRLEPGARLAVFASTGDPTGRHPFALFEGERRRREAILAQVPSSRPLVRALTLAADEFIARRGDLRTIVAGYPWFVDWGRDTMISLPGLCLTRGRFAEAQGILRAFARAVHQGLLPNRFPDQGETPEYNTVDASLWFFVAVRRYLEASGDESFVREELLPVLREILDWHTRGTRHGIHEDADGLLAAGEPGVQLTWMDAKVGDWVVTPRHGKPVEIQALWINALAILAELEERLGDPTAAVALRARSGRARERFGELFWNAEAGCLYDCVDGETRDASLRPNQIIALGLPFAVLPREQALAVLAVVEAKLATPVGLRTLTPDDPRYQRIYAGGPRERDGAYHQGPVWPWLLGPYVTALVRLRGADGRRQGRELLERFAAHLGEAGVGTVSEILDAEPPHTPRGCFAQAWSVAEILRAAVEDLDLGEATDAPPRTARRRVR